VREEVPAALHPPLGVLDLPLGVRVVQRATFLVQPQAHEAQICPAGGERLVRGELDLARDAVSHASRLVQREFTRHRAVAGRQQFLRRNGMERVAAFRPGKSEAVQGVEGGGGGARVDSRSAETERQRHGQHSRGRDEVGDRVRLPDVKCVCAVRPTVRSHRRCRMLPELPVRVRLEPRQCFGHVRPAEADSEVVSRVAEDRARHKKNARLPDQPLHEALGRQIRH
jgi:hypothetical protein